MRKPIIAGNWKMHKTIAEAMELANGLKRLLYEIENLDLVICPAFTALSEVAEAISESNIRLGAQDVYWQDEGAFTGEISCRMLQDAGCQFVIIGHSERRQYFGENNETVNKKVKAAISFGLTPIVCIGETLAQREKGLTFQVLKDQLKNGLQGIDADTAAKLVIAYEPVWAIGTGRTSTPGQAQEAHSYIRDLLRKMYTEVASQAIRIQYGGSVKPENIADLMEQPDIDGALVGGASLSIESFGLIVKRASEVVK